MVVHYSLAYLRDEGYRITGYCESPEREACRHSADLDYAALIEHFGPDFVIPRDRARFVAALRCAKCGGRHVDIMIGAPNGFRAGAAASS